MRWHLKVAMTFLSIVHIKDERMENKAFYRVL